ncbi:MAG TPA: precorrin-6A synthase (deacetylating) [Propionibacteriaceae bacterium]|nr:precorrin-6A synthase (deacetylating) [Propionibacteriaceae bacterium]
MTIQALVIGIGSGNPDHLTREAVAALNQVDMFLMADKGAAKHDLISLRTELCRRLITHDHYRFVEVPDPERGPDRVRDATDYQAGVAAWHDARAQQYAEIINAEVDDGETIGFLVWGDPAFYDSTIRIVQSIADLGVDLDLTVIPGVSSIQLLAARHKIILTRIGQPIHVTTGRRLLDEYSPALGDVVVMLDGELACSGLVAQFSDLMIYWGAQLGLPDEALISGRLSEVIDEIQAKRAAVRKARGWVMDTYLLRPPH